MKSINHKAGEKQDIQTWNQKLSLNYKQGLKSAQATMKVFNTVFKASVTFY